MAAADTIQAIINNAIAVANTQQDNASEFAGQAISAANSVVTSGGSGFSFTPNVPDLGVAIPAYASGDASILFTSLFEQVKNSLVSQFASFFVQYFPNECDYLGKAQDWLCDTLENGGTGMNASVEVQIWQRDRARVLQEGERVEEEILVNFASKGYPVPPGAAVWATYRAQQAVQDKVSQASRDVAIKQAEIEVENVKFAVTQAITLRVEAVQAAAGYINALARAADVGSTVSRNTSSAQAELINAASNYYRARVSVEELRLRALEGNAKLRQGNQELDVRAFTARSENVTHAATSAANAAGAMAAAALNALHSQAVLQSVENT